MKRMLILTSVFSAAVLIAAPGARAGVVAQDDFNYTTNSRLNGADGGTGWTSAWVVNSNQVSRAVIRSTSTDPLTFKVPGNGTISGGTKSMKYRGVSESDNFPDLAHRAFIQQSGQELFASFLLRSDSTVANAEPEDIVEFWLNNANTGIGVSGTGQTAGTGFFAVIGSNRSFISGPTFLRGESNLVVMRIAKNDDSSTFNEVDIWVNPGVTEANSPQATVTGQTGISTLSLAGLKQVGLDVNDAFWFDRLTIGTTFADVVAPENPIPEPASLGFLGLGTLALLMRRRRKLA